MKILKVLYATIICIFCVHVIYAENSQQAASSDNNVKIIGNSTNNDKYWYGRHVYTKMDSNGNPISDSYKYIYPENDCSYEVRFSYLENPDTKFPVYIYLNEINDNGIVKSEIIGLINKNIKSSVEFKSDGVNIFTPNKHIHVHADGMIIIYENISETYANGTCRMFIPTEAASVIYKVRYDVLIDKLRKIVKQ